MAIGPGRYDDLCTYVRKQAKSKAAIVIVIEGEKGMGFSCQGDLKTMLRLPDILETIAKDMRADVPSGVH